MWIARDENYDLHLFVTSVKPIRDTNLNLWKSTSDASIELNESLFQNVLWEDEPLEVDIVPVTPYMEH